MTGVCVCVSSDPNLQLIFCRPVAVGYAHAHFFKALVVYVVAVQDYMLSTFDAFVDGWSVFVFGQRQHTLGSQILTCS